MYHRRPMREPPFRQPLLLQPYERLTPFAFSRVVDEVRAVCSPSWKKTSKCGSTRWGRWRASGTTAWGRDRHVVVFHPILNRPDVPEEIVRFVAKHELAHIAVPKAGHPPEFWEKEWAVGRDRFAVWAWIARNLNPAFARNRHGIWVRRDWRRRLPRQLGPYTPHLAFDDPPFRVLCPDGGAQLRFEPTWSAAPAPFGDEPEHGERRLGGAVRGVRSHFSYLQTHSHSGPR